MEISSVILEQSLLTHIYRIQEEQMTKKNITGCASSDEKYMNLQQ